jgi:hypothetical protein
VQIGFLQGFLGFAVVAQNAARDPVEPAIVPRHDRAECLRLPGERPVHQLRVVRLVELADLLSPKRHRRSSVSTLDAIPAKRFPDGI